MSGDGKVRALSYGVALGPARRPGLSEHFFASWRLCERLFSLILCAKSYAESAPRAPPRTLPGCTIVSSRGSCPKSDVVTPDQGWFVPGHHVTSFTFNPLGWRSEEHTSELQ